MQSCSVWIFFLQTVLLLLLLLLHVCVLASGPNVGFALIKGVSGKVQEASNVEIKTKTQVWLRECVPFSAIRKPCKQQMYQTP